MFLDVGVFEVFRDDKVLSLNQLLEFIRASADGKLSVAYIRPVLVIDSFAGDIKFIGEKLQQRRGRLLGRKADRVLVDDLRPRDGRDVLRLFTVRVVGNPIDRVYDVGRGKRRTVVEPQIFSQMKNPGIGRFHFPALGQHAEVFAFFEIVSDETSQDLAPDGVEKGDAIAVRIEGLHGFSDADRDAGLRPERWRHTHAG